MNTPRLVIAAAAALFAIGCALSLGLGARNGAEDDTTIILVRHAEKVDESEDPDLSPAGRQRAARLAEALRDSGIAAVYTTTYKRTRQTGATVADRLGLAAEARHELPRSLSPAQTVGRLRAEAPGKAVLVVGHSNTIPPLLKALGWEEPAIPDADFGRLYVITLRPDGSRRLLRAGYPPEPPP